MIYLDNHATTPMDRRVLEAMLPLMEHQFGNASSSHELGVEVRQLVEQSTQTIAAALHASPSEIVYTSGATESNNLAIFGMCLHPRQKRKKIITIATEHSAVLDPVAKLGKLGFEVLMARVHSKGHRHAGVIDLEHLAQLIDSDTALVSIMMVNNETGTIQPLAEIAELCRKFGTVLHSDATQAIGRLPVDVNSLDVDLLSWSAHKFYGPKGIGGLYVRSQPRITRLTPQIVGGGQQNNLRSGTFNTPGIIGMAKAFQLVEDDLPRDSQHIAQLRSQLWGGLSTMCPGIQLNAADWESGSRVDGNLSIRFPNIQGQTLLARTRQVAASAGSACSAADPKPSHVLIAIGCTEDEALCTIRFGIGRFNTQSDISFAVDSYSQAFNELSSS